MLTSACRLSIATSLSSRRGGRLAARRRNPGQAPAGTLSRKPVTDLSRPSSITAKSVPLIMSASLAGPRAQENLSLSAKPSARPASVNKKPGKRCCAAPISALIWSGPRLSPADPHMPRFRSGLRQAEPCDGRDLFRFRVRYSDCRSLRGRSSYSPHEVAGCRPWASAHARRSFARAQ
jgi:hypothetical protein